MDTPMSWTSPKTWVDNELVTAALLNAHLRDNLRVLFRNLTFSQVQTNNTSTGETNLTILTIPANTLAQDGDRIEFLATGAVANNANAKTLRLYVGGSGGSGGTIGFSGALPTSAAVSWNVRTTIRRTGATSAVVESVVVSGTTVFFASVASITVTHANAFEIRMTGQGGGTSDVLQYSAFADIRGIAA